MLRRNILSHFFDGLNYSLSAGKPKNNSLLRNKNTEGEIIKQKGTRMANDGEDVRNRLETTILKSLANFFQIHERCRSSFKLTKNNFLLYL